MAELKLDEVLDSSSSPTPPLVERASPERKLAHKFIFFILPTLQLLYIYCMFISLGIKLKDSFSIFHLSRCFKVGHWQTFMQVKFALEMTVRRVLFYGFRSLIYIRSYHILRGEYGSQLDHALNANGSIPDPNILILDVSVIAIMKAHLVTWRVSVEFCS